ncbi:dipeptidase [Sphingosinicella rhizophila]|uniref:Membrane dipeptidase n=1 Tax=Sphingosinicella rhizophila TaxID=3050082 RepID=A0ABU3QAJ5_9SPHN|nr:membrane dipeptidase [Sphingosinicella sp. GR2756]MDT9600317.1 membrane dipeptidase [Sphingosinicella sp. GR2756]
MTISVLPPTRRAFLAGAAAMACAGTASARAFGIERYRAVPVIDALGSLGNLDVKSPRIAEQLAAYRASGLTAINQTVGAGGNSPGRFEETLRRITRYANFIQAFPDRLMQVRTAADLETAKAAGKLGVIFGFQDSVPLESEIQRLDLFHNLGVRIVQLTYNKRNLLGDGCLESGNGGLSEFGREVVAGLNARHMMVDASHAAARTIADAIASSAAPIAISHSGCRALVDVPRNTNDREIRALADKGGVIGIYFMPFLRKSGQPQAEDVLRHLEHAVKIAGEDHVALGTDGGIRSQANDAAALEAQRLFYEERKAQGVAAPGEAADVLNFVPQYNEPARFLRLADDLAARGWSTRRIEKILGGNFARLCGEVWGG